MKRKINIIAGLLCAAALAMGASVPGLSTPPHRHHLLGSPAAPEGGVKRLRADQEPPTLNPLSADAYEAVQIQFYVIEPLLWRNLETYEWQPALADQWSISEDGTQYTFRLRAGALWGDGRPVTPEDIKFSLEVIFDDAYPIAHLRPYYESLKKIEITGPRTVTFTATSSYFRNFFSAAALPIVPKHIYGDPEKALKINDTLYGSGPYRIDEFSRGHYIRLKKNHLWWGYDDPLYQGKHKPDELLFRFVHDDNVAFEMLKKGQIDFLPLSISLYKNTFDDESWNKTIFRKKVANQAPQPVSVIEWNLENPILKDRRVRLALAHLMDRELMIKKFFRDLMLPATGPWYKQSEYADATTKPISFNPEKALELLRSSGWKDRNRDQILEKQVNGREYPLQLTILTGDQAAARYLSLFREDARKAGVDINIKFLDWNALGHLMNERKFDGLFMTLGGTLVEFDPAPTWHSKNAKPGGSNRTGYHNADVDKLIQQVHESNSRSDRIEPMRRIFRQITYDQPCLFMFNGRYSMYAHTERVGMEAPTLRYGIGDQYWWMEEH